MSFRGKTFILTLFFLMTSCSWWGGDESNHDTGISLDVGDVLRYGSVSCIKETGSFFADYFYGRSSASEIRTMQTCIESTLDSMFDLAYKDDSIGFNRERIKNVLASVIDNNDEYNLDDLADLIFGLKRLFIGGGKDSFFKEEWERLRPDLFDIANALIASQDSAKIIFFSAHDNNLLEREGFYYRLKSSFRAVDRVKNKHAKTLEIEEIENLVSVLLKVSGLDRFTQIALTARKIIYPTESIFEHEQGDFLKTVWDVFELQTRVREIDFSEGILVGESSADVIKALDILTNRLLIWAERYPETYSFSTDDIKNLVNQMFDIGFLNDTIKDATPINQTIENMFIRIFGDSNLFLEDFQLLRETFTGWAHYYPKLLEELDSSWAQNVYSVLADEVDFNSESNEVMDEILNSFEEPKFISGPNIPIHILYNKRRALTPEENYLDKSLKQLFLSLAIPVMKAYNPELNETVRSGEIVFNTEGLDRLLYDFRPVGLELGFINRYSCNSSGRIFIESNLLTQNSNGDDYISLIEAAEWLGTMIVTSSLTNHVFSRIDEECAYRGEEVYGYPFYDRSCFQRSLFNNRANLENYFPGFLSYMDLLRSDSRREEFEAKIGGWLNYAQSYYDYNDLDPDFFEVVFMNQMNTCFQVKDTEDYLDFPLSRAEFNATVATLIYVENFFAQYDTTGLDSVWGSDPEGADLIIDGQELSAFARDKVNDEYIRLAAKAVKDLSWITNIASENWWFNRLRNLPEWAFKADRQRATDFIKRLMSDIVEVDQLEHNFCEQVMASGRDFGEVSYDTEAALQCPIVD